MMRAGGFRSGITWDTVPGVAVADARRQAIAPEPRRGSRGSALLLDDLGLFDLLGGRALGLRGHARGVAADLDVRVGRKAALEVPDGLPEPLADGGEAVRAEDQEENDQDDQELAHRKVAHVGLQYSA